MIGAAYAALPSLFFLSLFSLVIPGLTRDRVLVSLCLPSFSFLDPNLRWGYSSFSPVIPAKAGIQKKSLWLYIPPCFLVKNTREQRAPP